MDKSFDETMARFEREVRELKTAKRIPSMFKGYQWRGTSTKFEYGIFEITYADGDAPILSDLLYMSGGVGLTPETPGNNTQRFFCEGLRQSNLVIVATRKILSVEKVSQ